MDGSKSADAQDAHFVPHDVLAETGQTALAGLVGGFFIAAVRNAQSRRNVGALGVFTQGATAIGLCTIAPAAGRFVDSVTSNLREKEDALAAAMGGFTTGSILGLHFRRMPVVLGFGASVAVAGATFRFLGSRIDSFREEDDEFERKEIMRRTTRVPVEQTVAHIGEGRGFRPPGYEERRRQRLKEKYGIEVNPVSATIEGSK